MFTQRQIELRASVQHCGRMREFTESPFSMICAHAGVTCSVERRPLDEQVQADFVDASAAVLLSLHGLFRPFDILGEQIQRETVFSFRDRIHQLVDLFILERYDRDQRAEQFMLDDVFIDADRIDDRR